MTIRTMSGLVARLHKTRFGNGGSGTRVGVKLTVTEILVLTLRPYESGGTVHLRRCGLRMTIWLTAALAQDEPS